MYIVVDAERLVYSQKRNILGDVIIESEINSKDHRTMNGSR